MLRRAKAPRPTRRGNHQNRATDARPNARPNARPGAQPPAPRGEKGVPASAPSGRRATQTRTRAVALALIVVLAVVIVRLATCGGRGHISAVQTGVSVANLRKSPFDWSMLKTSDNGRRSYVVDGRTVSRAGIDVSEHQGKIDWEAVAKDGIDFAYVRVGFRSTDRGLVAEDDYALTNLSGASAAGLPLGVYFYSQATTTDEAVEEAEFVLDRVGSTELTYPVAFDFEPGGTQGSDRISALSTEERTAIALAFCDRIEQGGQRAVVYGNANALDGYDLKQLAARGFWYAQYDAAPSTDLRIGIWQYSNAGSVAGIDGDVDLDLDLTPVFVDEEAAQ